MLEMQKEPESVERDIFFTLKGIRNRSKNTQHIEISSTPLNVYLPLNKLWATAKSVILTSATATFGTPQQTEINYGLTPGLNKTIVLPPTFDLKKSVKAFIVEGISPKEDGIPKFIEVCTPIIDALQGRSLMLFTSYKALHQARELLAPLAQKRGIQILYQKTGETPHMLVEHMKRNPHTLLLATTSLWTGIDIPGQNLSAVLVHKLPFETPTPFTNAISEYLLRVENRNHFKEIAIPETVNHLKQGIGRLIRTEKDTGILLVADERIVKSSYAGTFIKALKDYPWQKIKTTDQLPSREELVKHCQINEKENQFQLI
jgi:ATP-dependent DNA helicase DinG